MPLPSRSFAVLLLIGCVVPALEAQAPVAAETFTDRTDVVLLELDLDVADRRDRPVDDLTAADLEVLVDGQSVAILAVERGLSLASRLRATPVAATPPSDPAAPSATPPVAVEEPWEIVIWADRFLSRPRSIPRVAAALAERAADLAALGKVDIFVSDTSPRQLLGASRDPRQIAASLKELGRTVGADTIRRERQRLAADASATPGRGLHLLVRARLAEERRLILGALGALGDELVGRGPETRRRLVILVGDGFDLDPASIVAGLTGEGALAEVEQLRRELAADATALGVGAQVEALATRLAATGWTLIAAADGAFDVPGGAGADSAGREVYRRHMSAPTASELGRGNRLVDDALGGLAQLAEATGGLVRTGANGTVEAIERLSSRWRVAVQIERPADRVRGIEVKAKRDGLVISHRRFLGVSGSAERASRLARRSLAGEPAADATGLVVRLVREGVTEERPGVFATRLVVHLDPAPQGSPGTNVGDLALAIAVADRPPLVGSQPLVVPPLPAEGVAPAAIAIELTVRTKEKAPRIAVGVVNRNSGGSGAAVDGEPLR